MPQAMQNSSSETLSGLDFQTSSFASASILSKDLISIVLFLFGIIFGLDAAGRGEARRGVARQGAV